MLEPASANAAPTLSVIKRTCQIGISCNVGISLSGFDPATEDVAAVAATLSATNLSCASCTGVGGGANGECSVNEETCRFVLADLEDPFTTFETGMIAEITATCTALGDRTVTILGQQGSDADGVPVSIGAGNSGVVRCVSTLCGNGQIDAGEECDDGNIVQARCEYCRSDCKATICGNPGGWEDGGEDVITAGDALAVLKIAVSSGSKPIAKNRCDAAGGGTVVASDALRVLKRAVGQDVQLACSE